MFVKILVTLSVVSCASVCSYQGLGDIHDEKYVCVTSQNNNNNDMAKINSRRRILLISPQKNYLYNRSKGHSIIFFNCFKCRSVVPD